MPAPDFLCIGAQKAGTTWLHHQLAQHPDIWLPALKELHYFDRLHVKRYAHLLFSRTPQGRFVRGLLWQPIKPAYTFSWVFRYIFGKRTEKHYFSLFEPSPGQICGEITPAYGRLGASEVAQINTLLPRGKVMYLLRNPVDRIWSQIQMEQRRNRHLSHTAAWDNNSKMMIANSSYSQNLANWEKAFAKERVFVGFFEQIMEEPKQLLLDIYAFLGVKGGEGYVPATLAQKHNARGNYDTMPPDFERFLTELMYEELERLHRRFGNAYTEAWLARANACLAGGVTR